MYEVLLFKYLNAVRLRFMLQLKSMQMFAALRFALFKYERENTTVLKLV
jgi:hypothetical protein